ncbi:hypothetical protein JCM8097_007880 [Rhodosporidiobolus ruineniae]
MLSFTFDATEWSNYNISLSHPLFFPFSSGDWSFTSHRRDESGRMDFDLFQGSVGASVTVELEIAEPLALETTECYTAPSAVPAESPVCLSFSNGCSLYVPPTLLARVSPYWQLRLASSGFSDIGGEQGDYEDSDDEADEVVAEQDEEEARSDFRRLGISSFSYTSYAAFLAFTQKIEPTFATLTSTYRLRKGEVVSYAEAIAARHHDLAAYHSAFPSLPLPVSPKSLYRLAHFLEIPSLQRVALDGLKARLTINNIALELFSTFSTLYDDVGAIELEFLTEHFEEVRKSEGLKMLIEEMEMEEPVGDRKTLLRALKAMRAQ